MKTAEEIAVERIARLYKERGLKQKELAKKAKITPESLNKILKGKRPPGRTTLKLLAEALGTTPEELYGIPSVRTPSQPTLVDAVSLLSAFQKAKSDRRAIALFFLTDDESHLEAVPDLAPALEALSQVKR